MAGTRWTEAKWIMAAVAAGMLVSLMSCERSPGGGNAEAAHAHSGDWLRGTTQQKLDALAEQHGGFSHTMMEVGYRYTELYWAGEDENWDFADYQIEHILEAMELGFVRRPERRASAELFMTTALPAMEEAVERRDRELFRERFADLASHCNACHAMEAVGFIRIDIPTVRPSPWRGP